MTNIIRFPTAAPVPATDQEVLAKLIAESERVGFRLQKLLAVVAEHEDRIATLKSALAIREARIERLTPDAERWRWWRKEYRAIDAIGDELDTLVDNEISTEGEE